MEFHWTGDIHCFLRVWNLCRLTRQCISTILGELSNENNMCHFLPYNYEACGREARFIRGQTIIWLFDLNRITTLCTIHVSPICSSLLLFLFLVFQGVSLFGCCFVYSQLYPCAHVFLVKHYVLRCPCDSVTFYGKRNILFCDPCFYWLLEALLFRSSRHVIFVLFGDKLTLYFCDIQCKQYCDSSVTSGCKLDFPRP